MPILAEAQVSVGASSPHPSAMLDVNSTTKGFLPPRVALTGTGDNSTVASPVNGLIVYNTASAGVSPNNVSPGYYYYEGNKWNKIVITQPDATIGFNKATPTTAGVVFTPNTQNSTDYIYVSSVDNSMWTYNGTAYVTYVPPKSTAWYLNNSSNDAGSNKDSAVFRTGRMGIGATNPTTTIEIGATNGDVPGKLQVNPQSTFSEGGQITLKKSVTGGATSDWAIEQNASSTPVFRIIPGTSAWSGISISESGKMSIGSFAIGQSQKLLVEGSAKITGNLDANGGYFMVAGLSRDTSVPANTSSNPFLIPLKDASDPNSWWDENTFYNFKPTVAGYYFVSVMVSWANNANSDGKMSIRLNFYSAGGGSPVLLASAENKLPKYTSFTQSLTALVYMDGGTNYLNLVAVNGNSSEAVKINSSQIWTKMEAYKLN